MAGSIKVVRSNRPPRASNRAAEYVDAILVESKRNSGGNANAFVDAIERLDVPAGNDRSEIHELLTADLIVPDFPWIASEAYLTLLKLERRAPEGLVLTPLALADRVCQELDPSLPVVDLAAGTGLLSIAAGRRGLKVVAVEVDKNLARIAQGLVRAIGLADQVTVVAKDAFSIKGMAPSQIVSNPPYTRHHHLTHKHKERLHKLARKSGLHLPRTAGHYAYFMAWAWNAPWSRREVFLVPTNWLETGYGASLRSFFSTQFVGSLPDIQHVEQPLHFNGVLTTACIVVTDTREPVQGHVILNPLSKRNRVSNHHTTVRSIPKSNNRLARSGIRRLGDLFEIHRGLATGANSFFLISDETSETFEIPDGDMVPVIPSLWPAKARRLPARLWVAPDDLNIGSARYVAQGEAIGLDRRTLCKARNPWWQLAMPPLSPYLISCMGRRHVRLVHNDGNRVNLNNAHGLVPLEGVDGDLARRIITFLSSRQGQVSLMAQARHYHGIWKLEPGNVTLVDLTGAPTSP